jgi:hypothetical protein
MAADVLLVAGTLGTLSYSARRTCVVFANSRHWDMAMLRAVILALLISIALSTSYGQTVSNRGTTTNLSLAPSEGTTRVGAVVKLTAIVASSSLPVPRGLVKFCDAKAPRCSGLAILGTAQLAANGTATLNLTLGPGKHRIRAVFPGTPHSDPPASASTSDIESITVQGAASVGLNGESN